MIELDDRYVITYDKYNLILNRIIKPEDADEALLQRLGKQRAKKDRLEPIGYFSNIEDLLLAYKNNCIRVSETVKELESALKKIDKAIRQVKVHE